MAVWLFSAWLPGITVPLTGGVGRAGKGCCGPVVIGSSCGISCGSWRCISEDDGGEKPSGFCSEVAGKAGNLTGTCRAGAWNGTYILLQRQQL